MVFILLGAVDPVTVVDGVGVEDLFPTAGPFAFSSGRSLNIVPEESTIVPT